MWTQIIPPRWWVELSRPVIACKLQTMDMPLKQNAPESILHLVGVDSWIQMIFAKLHFQYWHLFLVGALCGTNNPCALVGSTTIRDHLLQTINNLNPSQVAAWEQAVHAISTLKIQSSLLTQSCTEVRGRHPFTLGTLNLVSEIKTLTLGSFMFLWTFQHHHHWTTFRILRWTTFPPVLHCAAPPWPRHLSFAVPTHRWDSPRWRRPWSGRMQWLVGGISSSKRLICGLTANHHTIAGNDVWCHLRRVPAPCLMHPRSPKCQRLVLVLESWTWKIYENLKDWVARRTHNSCEHVTSSQDSQAFSSGVASLMLFTSSAAIQLQIAAWLLVCSEISWKEINTLYLTRLSSFTVLFIAINSNQSQWNLEMSCNFGAFRFIILRPSLSSDTLESLPAPFLPMWLRGTVTSSIRSPGTKSEVPWTRYNRRQVMVVITKS